MLLVSQLIYNLEPKMCMCALKAPTRKTPHHLDHSTSDRLLCQDKDVTASEEFSRKSSANSNNYNLQTISKLDTRR